MNEKEKDIRLLLNRFMAGETSLEEEALLGEWFRQHPDVSDDLKEYQLMFGYFDEGMPLDYEAENHVENAHPKAKARMRRLWLPLSLAASIALLIGFTIPWVGQQTGIKMIRRWLNSMAVQLRMMLILLLSTRRNRQMPIFPCLKR